MTDLTIRRAAPDDAPAVARYMADEAVFGELLQLPYPDEARWRKRLESSSTPGAVDLHLVAVRDAQVVGAAGLFVPTPAVRRRHAASLGISVARDAQGQGVGSALMAALIDYADRWAGLTRLELTVWADNRVAQALHRKFGFEEEGRLRGYGLRAGAYVDALTMARLIAPPHRS